MDKQYYSIYYIVSYCETLFGLVGLALSGYVVGQVKHAFPLSVLTLVLTVLTFVYVPLRTFLDRFQHRIIYIFSFVIDGAICIASVVAMILNVSKTRWKTRYCSSENIKEGKIRQSQCNVGAALVVINVLMIISFAISTFYLWKRIFSGYRSKVEMN